MAAIEGSYDRDWVRFRLSFFFASGDGNINNSHATGFDTILDQPNFAGGGFSFWNRQQIALQGVNLVQRLSLVPDLRSSKIQGQANFVNPGLILPTFGMDFDVTPKMKLITNFNLIWFDKTSALQQFLFQGNIDRFVGVDLGLGLRVPAAPERERALRRRRADAHPRAGLPGHLRQLQRPGRRPGRGVHQRRVHVLKVDLDGS